MTSASTEPLSMWVVYDHPRDHPGHFIARRFEIHAGEQRATQDVRFGSSLAELRAQAPAGSVALPRDPSDDPVIVECWI